MLQSHKRKFSKTKCFSIAIGRKYKWHIAVQQENLQCCRSCRDFSISNKFFQYISTGVILPLSNNDTNTDVEIRENREKYFVLSTPDEANK